MFKVLVVDDEPQIREVFELILEANDNIEVKFAASGNQAIELLKENNDIGLILCDYRMEDGNGGDVFNWVYTNLPQAAFTLVSTYEPASLSGFENFSERPERYNFLTKPFSAESILKLVDDKVSQSEQFQEYFRIKLTTLLAFVGKMRADIFVKIHEEKMVKIIDDNDDIDSGIINRYIQKDMIWGYVYKDIAHKLISIKIDEVLKQFANVTIKPNYAERGDNLLQSLDLAREIIQTLGIDERVFVVTESAVQGAIDFIEETKGLNDLLKLIEKRDSYISSHGLLSSYIATSLIQKLEWNTPEMKKKMTLVCLFQNISLETEALAKVHSSFDDEFEQLNLKDQKIVLEHPRFSAEILNAKNYYDTDITTLILNHHESPYGNGFPRGLNSTQLSPIDGVIILSSHFADVILKDRSKELKLLAQDFNEIYNKGNFKKVYSALLKVFIEIAS